MRDGEKGRNKERDRVRYGMRDEEIGKRGKTERGG